MIHPDLISLISTEANAYLLILARVASTLGMVSFLRREVFPARVAIILSMSLSLFILKILPVGVILADVTYPVLMFNMVVQTFLGFLMAFILNIFIEIFISLGQVIAVQSGLGFANLYIPRLGSLSPFAVFFMITATLLLFELNGHLILMKMLVKSFEPDLLLFHHLRADVLDEVLLFAKIIFSGALMLSLSIIIAMLISNLTLAVMTKFAPQLNIFSVGINLSLIIAFFTVYICFDLILEEGRLLLNDTLDFMARVMNYVTR